MEIITLRDYAEQNKISYEAVRKQVARYQNDLEGHLIRKGRQQFLDETAVSFLDEKRKSNPVVLVQRDKDEQIEELERQVKQLLVKTAAQADKISELAEWKSDHALLIATADQNRLALEAAKEAHEKLQAAYDDAKVEIEVKQQEIEKIRQEAADAIQEQEKAFQDERAEYEKKIYELEHRSFWKRLFGGT